MTGDATLGVFFDRQVASLVGIVAVDAVIIAMRTGKVLIVLLAILYEAATGGNGVDVTAMMALTTEFRRRIQGHGRPRAVALLTLNTWREERAVDTG